MKTRIYIDVDGVLNAFHPRKKTPEQITEASGWSRWKSKRVNGYVITWSEELVEELNDLAARDDVEFVWLTTWRDEARLQIAPALLLDGHEWRYLSDGGEATGALWGKPHGPWWKFEVIQEDVRRDPVDHIIWIDDDLAIHPEALEWASERGVVAVAPSHFYGLTRGELDAILEVVNAVEDKTS